jgi:hypothetical protein
MPTPVHILKAKPDPRGRLALGKAIEAVNNFLATSISGFDCLMNSDGSLLLRPMVEVEARSTFRMDQSDWADFNVAIARPVSKPNAALRAVGEAFKSRIRTGGFTLSSDLETGLGTTETAEEPIARRSRAPEHLMSTQSTRAPKAVIKARKKPVKH